MPEYSMILVIALSFLIPYPSKYFAFVLILYISTTHENYSIRQVTPKIL